MPPTAGDSHDQGPAKRRVDTGRGSRRISAADAIERFAPKHVPPEVWSRIGGVARDWVSQAGSTGSKPTVAVMGMVTQLLWWADGAGEPLEANVLFHPETIDRFLETGCQHLKPGTRSSYRTVLRRVGRTLIGPDLFPPPSIEIAARDPQAPYGPDEISAQRSWVRGLPTEHMRRNALALLALGLGAGLRAHEMAQLRGDDVSRDGDGVLVHVDGRNERDVPVLEHWEDTVFSLAGEVGRCFVFRPDRAEAEHHQTSNFIARCAKSVGAPPAFSLLRLRGTWLVRHLMAGIPPNELARAAGIQRTQLAKYFNLLPAVDPSTIRGWLREGGRR